MKTINTAPNSPNTAPNSPFKGYYPNVTPFGNSPRYDLPGGMTAAYKRACNHEDDVTSTIKPIDREKANLEAEKNEVLLTFKPSGIALHKIQGKPHSKGGTPLNVPDGSFIFSKDKSMALSKEEIEEFNLGKFQKGGLINNSPAKVLERNVNLKHNNRMVDALENSKNFAEKNTARLMLEKYQRAISSIAALQEIRKPEAEMPQFAQLIPKNPMVEQQEERQEQYSLGGWVSKKPLPKAQLGITYKIVNGIRVPIDAPPSTEDYAPGTYKLQQEVINSKPYEPITPQMQDAVVDRKVNASIDMSTNQDLNLNDDMSWIKPYDWTPKALSMIGNLMQSPRSLYPSLALQTPYQVREQSVDAQPGIDAINANAFASRKASQMYASPQQQNNQLINAQANKMATDYASRIAQANQQNATNVHNTNAQISNQALNTNNQSRAQFLDKVNELKQNVSDTRNAISATNLNLLGEGMNEKRNYDTTIDFMKKYQPWNVQSKMSQKDLGKVMEDYMNMMKQYPSADPTMQYYILKTMLAPHQKQNVNMEMLKSILN